MDLWVFNLARCTLFLRLIVSAVAYIWLASVSFAQDQTPTQSDATSNGSTENGTTSNGGGDVVIGEGLTETSLAPPASNYGLSSDRVIIIGTAPVSGVYYAAGGAICSMVNKNYPRHGIRCLVEPSKGSGDNIAALNAHRIDLAIVQSDWQHYAYRGVAGFQNVGANKNLRSLFSLHRHAMVFVVGPDSGIKHVIDLKNKKVNLGRQGSGQRILTNLVLSAGNLAPEDLALTADLDTRRQSMGLCDGSLDAFILPASTPSYAIAEAVNACRGEVRPLNGPRMRKIVNENPYFVPYAIPKGSYRGMAEDVPTFGLVATVVATTDMPDDVAYEVTASVFDALEEFKNQHLALRRLTTEDMVGAGSTAPSHDGAQRFFNERGLKKK